MSTAPKLPPLPDLVRTYAPTIEETAKRIVDFLIRRPPGWSYNPAKDAASAALLHSAPLSALRHGMLTSGSPTGRTQNVEVVEHLWQAGEGRQLRTYAHPLRTYPIRRDLAPRVPINFVLVEHRKPSVFWLQPRRCYAFNQLGLGVMASILRATYLVEELEGAGLEILDLSAPHKERLHVLYRLENLPTISDAEVAAVLQHLADAYDLVCQMDRDWQAEAKKWKGGRPPPPPPPPGLFG